MNPTQNDTPTSSIIDQSWVKMIGSNLVTLLGWLLVAVAIWIGMGVLRAPDLPEQAPEFTLQDLDGIEVSLSDFRGQTVVVNFWATWCGPCRMEIPSFSSFAQSNPDVVVLGIAVDGSAAQLRRAKAQLGIEYQVLVADASVQHDYGVKSLPTTVIVDADGAIRSAYSGIMLLPQLSWATRQ